jgi:Zn finger protein HypA/HybF involved in hydrogenase expression
MHELALTNSIVDTVLDEMRVRRLSKVEVIGLRVGVLH